MLPVVNPNLNLNDYSFNVVKVDIQCSLATSLRRFANENALQQFM